MAKEDEINYSLVSYEVAIRTAGHHLRTAKDLVGKKYKKEEKKTDAMVYKQLDALESKLRELTL